MGTAISTIKEAQEKSEEKVKNEIKMLEEILKNKLDLYESEVTQSSQKDGTIPIKYVIEKKRYSSVNVSDKPSPALDKVLDDLFSGSFLSSLRGLAGVALRTVLGNSSGGSKEDINYKVMLLHNAIVRLDYKLYSYTLESEGVTLHVQNGICFFCSVSVIDLRVAGKEAIAYCIGSASEESSKYFKSHQGNTESYKKTLEAWREASTKSDALKRDLVNALNSCAWMFEQDFGPSKEYYIKGGDIEKEEKVVAEADLTETIKVYQGKLAEESRSTKNTIELVRDEEKRMLQHISEIYRSIQDVIDYEDKRKTKY
ncbi:hypothetical protein AKO1_008033 [Acrasis kona]|uniref:Uncharacterized protein n=1 Tax=Acrasis kona TaxID=1008807 RepID=A0AAW2YQU5_9EUKA